MLTAETLTAEMLTARMLTAEMVTAEMLTAEMVTAETGAPGNVTEHMGMTTASALVQDSLKMPIAEDSASQEALDASKATKNSSASLHKGEADQQVPTRRIGTHSTRNAVHLHQVASEQPQAAALMHTEARATRNARHAVPHSQLASDNTQAEEPVPKGKTEHGARDSVSEGQALLEEAEEEDWVPANNEAKQIAADTVLESQMSPEEAEVEEWVPSRGKAKRRAAAMKKSSSQAALGVAKKGSAVIGKKKGGQDVKKRAAKLAPFKGVTIKNNRLQRLITSSA